MVTILILLIAFIALDIAALRWGYDSRDSTRQLNNQRG